MEREIGLVSIVGNMFGGKTARTITLATEEKNMGRKIQAFKPGIDNRYGESYITTHDGAKIPATSVRSVSEMESLILKDTEVLVLDEAQFWPEELYDFVRQSLGSYTIILNGLQLNFRGEPFFLRTRNNPNFSQAERLRPSSEHTVMEIAGMGLIEMAYPKCNLRDEGHICRAQAIYPQRFRKGREDLMPYKDGEIVLGAGDQYSPRCVNHFAKPLPNGNFLYQGKQYSHEELKEEHPEIFNHQKQ